MNLYVLQYGGACPNGNVEICARLGHHLDGEWSTTRMSAAPAWLLGIAIQICKIHVETKHMYGLTVFWFHIFLGILRLDIGSW